MSKSIRADKLLHAISLLVFLRECRPSLPVLRGRGRKAVPEGSLETILRNKLENITGKRSSIWEIGIEKMSFAHLAMFLSENMGQVRSLRFSWEKLREIARSYHQEERIDEFVAICEAFSSGKVTLTDIPVELLV
jgi:hypothetical protein